MSLIQWPFKRKQYAGVNNPRFVSDIVSANEAVIDAIKALAGLSDIDFYIISGIEFDSGTSSYSTGVFYLNGQFYYIGATFASGLYLIGSPNDILSRPFSDAVSRNIYTVLSGISTSVSTGASPIFTGDMNQYRISNRKLKADQIAQQTVIDSLGNSATRDVGVTAGTVMAGDNTYTKSQIDSFTVKKLASGTKTIGDISDGAGTDVTVSFGVTLANTNYVFLGTVVSVTDPTHDALVAYCIKTKATDQIILHFQELVAQTQNINLDWIVLSM